jgi:excisionase family DNA binding protein
MRKAKNWLSTKEAAERLGITTRTLHRYIKEGKIAASQIVPNGKLRISLESIDRLFETSVRARTPEK